MFGNLFRRKKIVEDKVFTLDFKDALRRYMGVFDDSKIKYEFKDKKDNIIPPSHAFETTYSQWKTIQSVWDKRSVIFSALDDMYLDKIPKDQVIERFVIDRYPKKALMFAEEYMNNDDFKNDKILASLSKCYFFLSDYYKSIQLAQKAIELNKDNKKAKIALADSLHMLNQHDKAHEIFQNILSNSKLKEWNKDEINIIEIINYNNDILHSSVYAVGLLSNDETDENTWNKAAEEFYHCPFFRSQHAFWLLQKGESLKGLAKLIATTQEFPWYKDAVINTKSSILQFREQMNSNDLWENELTYVSEIIEENNW